MSEEEIVRAGTRRIVGHEALRRASQMVADWQAEEAGRAQLARRIIVALAVGCAALLAVYFLRRIF